MPTLPPQSPPFDATRHYQATSYDDSLVTRKAFAVGCVVAACAFSTIALLFAFRAAPSLGTMPPTVAAAVVIANAMLAIGAGGFGYGLLRIAERLSASS